MDTDDYFVYFVDILEYVDTGVRPLVEGERVFKSNHVIYCGITENFSNEVHFLALCLKSSALTEAPHEINVVLRRSNGKLFINCLCSCAAGQSGRCKHSIGVLMFLSRTPGCQVEEATCTDVKQKWGKLKNNVSAMYAAVPISEFCHLKKEKDFDRTKPVDVNIGTSFRNILINGLAIDKCELLQVTTAYRSEIRNSNDESEEEKQLICLIASSILSKVIHTPSQELINSITNEEKQYYSQQICVNQNDAVQLCLKTKFQNDYLWQEERRKRITASSAYGLYTYSRNKKADWETKINKHINSSFQGNADTRYGLLMEDAAIQCYQRCTDLKVISMGLLINPSIPWLGYSPDGIVENKCTIEIKSPKIGKTVSALDIVDSLHYLDYDLGGNIVLKVKHQYSCQVQLGMFITKLLFCHFIIYSSFDDSCLIIEVPYNQNLVVNEYIPILERIYFQYFLRALVRNNSNGNKENNNIDNNNNESLQ